MRPATLKKLRLALLGLVAGLGALVWGSLRSAPDAPTPEARPVPEATQPQGTHLDKVVFRSFSEGRESFLLEADRSVTRQDGQVELEGMTTLRFEFTSRGERHPATVRAKRGLYDPAAQRAVFEGDVHVVTGDGFELETQRLVYQGDRGTARASGAVSFSRKDMRGSGRGLDYRADEGTLEIEDDFSLVIEDPDEPRTDVTSRSATVDRGGGQIRLRDAVRLVQAGDQVDADWLTLYLDADERVERAQFGGGVVWTGGGGTPGSGGTLPLDGESRRLEGLRLDLEFRKDRTLSHGIAGPDAVLLVGPGRDGPREHRRLSAKYLTFGFDEQGQLSEVLGQGGSVYETEPLSPADGEPQRLTCRRLVARLHPGTRRLSEVEMDREVRFAQGTRRAWAETGHFRADEGILLLRGQPRLEDAEERSELFAQDINIHTRTRGVTASDHVRHVVRQGKVGPLGGAEDPVVVTSGQFRYRPEVPEFFYGQGVVLRAGADEIRSGTLRLEGEEEAERRLTAEGSVVSRFAPGGSAEAGPIHATAETMVYDAGRDEVVYEHSVVIRRAEIETRSPRAVLQLDAETSSLVTLDAGEPVDVVFGERRGGGRRGRYTPADETMVLVGEDAWLRDPEQEVRGRALTFSLGDDTILIEGREQVRTEMLIREEP